MAYVLAYQFIAIILKLLYYDILLDLVLCLYTFMLSKFLFDIPLISFVSKFNDEQ